jgi:hypothetical protein
MFTDDNRQLKIAKNVLLADDLCTIMYVELVFDDKQLSCPPQPQLD